MKRKTYYNVMRASRMIMKKGYTQKEALEIAMRLFDEHENGELPIEHYIKMVITKKAWKMGEHIYEQKIIN